MKSKKLTGILIVAVIILLVCVVGTTFAYYFATLRGQNENTISTSKATLILTEQENPFDTVKIGKDMDFLYEGAPGYDFTISAHSNGKAAIDYAIYLEESEGNTINTEDISISISQVDSNGEEIWIYPYNYGVRCTNEREYSVIGDGHCSYYPEIHDELYSSEEVATNSNSYGANLIMHEYLFKTEKFNGFYCNDRKTYYYETFDENGEIISNFLGEENETVDNSYCTYYEGSYPYSKSLPLEGPESYKNTWLVGYNKYNNVQELEDKKIILVKSMLSSDGEKLNETVNYRLRYFINSDRLTGGTAQGTVNNDGSVSVELGQDGIFKFRIGVYAKSASPS